MDLNDKKVCITGSEGFLGSHLVDLLKEERECEIIRVKSSEYDLTEKSNIKDLLESTSPDVVIHLAANVGGIGANREKPGKYFYDNTIMGVELMEQARKHGVDKVTLLGTICAYPKHTEVPFKEEDLFDGYPEETNAPYGIAKRALLTQSKAYRRQYDFNSIYLMPVNLYGPRDNFDLETSHVIPAIIRKCVEAKENGDSKIVAWGTGKPTREFLYVKDAAKAILKATEDYDKSEPVNLGSNNEISIKELVELIKEKVGFEGEIEWDTSKPDGQPRRKLDVSKAKEEFGWEAKVSFEKGLEETIEWYIEERD